MTFFNAALLWGIPAVFIPLVLHWWFRGRFRQIDWGAMPLLRRVVRSSRRQLRWHQWILLMLRCAALLLLAIAMARPLAWSWSGGPTDSPMSLIIAIDDSRSMQAAGRDRRAVEAIGMLIDAAGQRDEVLLMPASTIAAEASSAMRFVDPVEARRSLADLHFDLGPIDWNDVAERARAVSRMAVHPNRRIVLLSDFQDLAKVQGLAKNVATSGSVSLRDEPTVDSSQPSVDLLSVADPDDELKNVSIDSIRLLEPVAQADRPVTFEAVIRNDSTEPRRDASVHWRWASQMEHHQRVSVPAMGTATVRWTLTPRQAGVRTIQVEVDAEDALAADNRRFRRVTVLDQVDVWLIDGRPSSEPLKGETDFLRLALAPFGERLSDQTDRIGASDWINVSVRTTRQLRQATRELSGDGAEDPAVVVLANIRAPEEVGSEWAARYLERGGALVFFDGDRVDRDAWADSRLLVQPLGEVVDFQTEQVNGADPSDDTKPASRKTVTTLLPGQKEPSLFLTSDSDQSASSRLEASFQLRRYRQSARPLADAPSDPGGVVWRTEQNTPLMWRQQVTGESEPAGRGRLVQWTVSADDSWSSLPLQPAWVPLMQQMIADLVLPVSVADDDRAKDDEPPPATEQWKPNVPAEESRFVAGEREASRRFADAIGASRFTDSSRLVDRFRIDRNGRELAGAAFWGLLMLLAAELIWQQRMGNAA